MNIKENQRFQQTHTQIMDTLIHLLKEKDLKQISVSEICREVHINRSTFYEHFVDVYDLMQKIEKDMSKELKDCYQQGMMVSNKEAFLNLFCYVRKKKKFYSVYLGQGNMLPITGELLGADFQRDGATLAEIRWITSQVQLDYHLDFFRAGINAIIRHWLDRDCAESPDELYDILEKEYQSTPNT